MSEFKYFNRDEFQCQHTGKNEIQDKLIHQLDKLRENCGFPFIITSGYRDSTHPIEAKKAKAGTHALGLAADIKVNNGVERYTIVREAIKLKFIPKEILRNKPFFIITHQLLLHQLLNPLKIQ